LKDLPDDFELTPFQERQRQAQNTDQPIVDRSGLKKFLGELKYPLWFFDFESINPAVPLYDGTHPYQHIPVQWSCHVVKKPGAEVDHFEFLASGESDPRRECLDSTIKLFKNFDGTIIAYNAAFEKSRIKSLAEWFPKNRDFLLKLNDHFWDLEEVFQNYFYHRDFGGSVSIKVTLPYFAPELSYKKLSVQDGDQARALLSKLLRNQIKSGEVKAIRADLLKYCEQDSLAMLVILEKISKTVAGGWS
jgi:hypothetical protein